MNSKLTKFAQAATLGLAITLTLNACEEKEKKQTASETTPEPAAAPAFKTVKIGNQTWMAENLNIETGNSKCYDDKPDNCKKYGRLYDWQTAMKACPSGWHLPSEKEWQTLVDFAGGDKVAGKKLKAKSGWNDYRGTSGNGVDAFGFSALPSSFGSPDGEGDFADVDFGLWWTSSDCTDGVLGSDYAYYRMIGNNDESVSYYNGYGNHKSIQYSIRCIKD